MLLLEFWAVAIVSKAHLNALPNAAKGVYIFKRNGSLGGIANVRHHIVGAHRILLDQLGNGTTAGRLRVVKALKASSLVHTNAEAMRVNVCFSASLAKSTQAEREVRLNEEVIMKGDIMLYERQNRKKTTDRTI